MSDSESQVTFQAPEIPDLAPLFPGYDIEILIATGGMGAVYRAVQRSLERTVAIKILPMEFSQDAAFCAGFEAEAKAMARLNHPNLIGVYDFGEVNGMLFIIMEYVPGQSVFHSANGTAIDPAEVTRLVSGVCNGLAHAHENGILHRDIKPSNILLDLNAEPKIGDFGLARPVDRKVEEGEEIFGTPHYTAPEVVAVPHSVDARADIFSVGVLLHELLTGQLPANDPRPASAISGCDPRFDAIIRRATDPQPDRRYSNAAEITKALDAVASSAGPRVLRTATPVSAAAPRPVAGPGAVRPLPAPQTSSSAPTIIMLLVAIALAGGAYLYYSSRQQAPQPTGETITPGTEETTADPSPGETAPVVETEPVVEIPDLPDPDPTPMPDVEPDVEPEPEPEPVAKTEPVFDVEGFFERARKIMREKAKPALNVYQANIDDNFEAFIRAIKRKLRRVSYSKAYSKRIEDALDEAITEWEAAGNRIPEELPRQINNIDDTEEILEEFLTKEEAIDESLAQQLSELADTYIHGLNLQIERLDETEDPVAVELIQEEITLTKTDPDWFPDLMRGITRTDASPAGLDRTDDDDESSGEDEAPDDGGIDLLDDE